MDLPLDIIKQIAACDQTTWIKLQAADPVFMRYAWADGRYAFLKRFSTQVVFFNRTETQIFGRVHSIDDQPAVIYNSVREWRINGVLNRPTGPTIIYADGEEHWHKNGMCHRDEDLPAIIYSDGRRDWYQFGLLHRDIGPAIIYSDGRHVWYQFGLQHREDGLPASIHRVLLNSTSWANVPTSELKWYCMGKLHRANGPAIIRADGTREWYWAGTRHRADGPAIIYADGSTDYWHMGVQGRRG